MQSKNAENRQKRILKNKFSRMGTPVPTSYPITTKFVIRESSQCVLYYAKFTLLCKYTVNCGRYEAKIANVTDFVIITMKLLYPPPRPMRAKFGTHGANPQSTLTCYISSESVYSVPHDGRKPLILPYFRTNYSLCGGAT